MKKETKPFSALDDQIGTPFEGMSDTEIRNRLNEDRTLLKTHINAVAEAFFEHPSKEAIYSFCDAMVNAYVYQIEFATPCEMHNEKPVYKTKYINNLGWAYLAYTVSDHTPMKNDILGVISARGLIEEVVANKEATGIIFNPESNEKSPAVLFLNRENVENVLRIAKETIKEQPEKVRQILLKGKQTS